MSERPESVILHERVDLLSSIARDLLTARDTRAAVNGFLDRLASHLDLDVYFSYLLGANGSGDPLESRSGVSEDVARKLRGVHSEEAMADPGGFSLEDVQHTRDGRLAPLRSAGLHAYVCHPLMAGGQFRGALGFATRRRSRLRAEELALLRMVADLVARAFEREQQGPGDGVLPEPTREDKAAILAREQAARAEAEEANRARDEFLAALSHELRTPLNVMLGWVRMLRSERLDPTQAAHALQVVERSIRAQTDLINDMLDVSRIVSGTLVLDMRPIDLALVVKTAVEAVRPSVAAKGVELRSTLGPAAMMTVGDGARLRQVASTLLTNALTVTPSGGHIAIGLDPAGDRARLVVSHTGEGIAPELLPHVFDRYRPRARAGGAPGLGLELPIVRRVVELHGGVVDASSAGVRKGATFTVELPLRPTERSRLLETGTGVPDDDERLDLLRVLVVDDHADTRDLLSVILKERGATVVTAGSVAEAQPLLGRFGPDIVLCDISMPDEDGFRLLEWIKEDERRKRRAIPAVALTAHARSEDRHRVLSAGFAAYLPKPLDLSDIVRVVRSVTGRAPRL